MTAQSLILKLCPFCGGKAEFHYDPGCWGYSPPTYSVFCTKCWCNTPKVDRTEWSPEKGTNYNEEKSKEGAADMWNNRHDFPCMHDLVKDCK